MELFSELYGCYYSVVAKIINAAHTLGITNGEINAIVEQEAFAESGLHLIPRLLNGDWALLEEKEKGCWFSKLRHADTSTPLTTLQKSWLRAIIADPRMRLFVSEEQLTQLNTWLADTQPLFDAAMFHTFDVALDSDPYHKEQYIVTFRTILAAIKEKSPLLLRYQRGKGGQMRAHFIPIQMQYSEKDDKFRVLGGEIHRSGKVSPIVFNIARIISAENSAVKVPPRFNASKLQQREQDKREILLHISTQRNALERCMMQFAFYEKETKPLEEGGYLCRIWYTVNDEAELLIRVLSFGPVIKVLEPEPFLAQLRERVKTQLAYLEAST